MRRHRRSLGLLIVLGLMSASGCDAQPPVLNKSIPPGVPVPPSVSGPAGFEAEPAEEARPVDGGLAVHSKPLSFGPFEWEVKSGDGLGPGPNRWSNSLNAVWLDDDGLHLKITKQPDGFSCAEVNTVQLAEFGTYRMTIAGTDFHQLDRNLVIGLFVYRDDSAEVDVELVGADAGGNLLFTVQPASERTSFRASTGETDVLTVELHWEPAVADFRCWQGSDVTAEPVAKWTYRGHEVPRPVDTHFHANVWLLGGRPPTSGDEVEVLIRDFQFTPLDQAKSSAVLSKARPSIQVWADGDGHGGSDVEGSVTGISPIDAEHFVARVYARTDAWYIQPFVGSSHRIDVKSLTFKTWTRPWYNGLRADLIDTRTGNVVATTTYTPGSPQPKPGNGSACWVRGSFKAGDESRGSLHVDEPIARELNG